MTEGVSSSTDAAAERAAEQARLRKERREAKIKAGGSSRLDKINGMGGRVVGGAFELPPFHVFPQSPYAAMTILTRRLALLDNNQAAPAAEATTTTTTPKATTAGDPDEVDISEHFYSPAAARLAAQQNAGAMPSPPAGGGFPGLPADMTEEQQAQLRQMMLGGAPPGAGGIPDGAEDPLMKMMSQMMGGGGGGAGGFPGMPGGAAAGGPNAASPFAGMMGAQQPASSGPDVYSTIWRIVHALLALGLGLYIVTTTPFNGTKIQRQLAFKVEDEKSADAFYEGSPGHELLAGELDVAKKNFFWAFATAEAVLLTTKFFLDKGRAPPPGFLWSMAGQLPAPWRGYVVNIMRYGQIFTTVRTDILLCAFVLGVCAWWRGQL